MRVLKALTVSAVLTVPSLAFAQGGAPATPPPPPFTLTTTAFEDGGVIPDKYTQANPNCCISPALAWTNTPAGTQSFTLIMHDPDNAPQKKVMDTLHWMAFNIPATSTGLAEGQPATAQLPDGTIQAKTRNIGFMGPGARGVYHHYTLELYALDTKLALGPDATREQVLAAMEGHVVGKAALEGRFHR